MQPKDDVPRIWMNLVESEGIIDQHVGNGMKHHHNVLLGDQKLHNCITMQPVAQWGPRQPHAALMMFYMGLKSPDLCQDQHFE